MNIALELIEQGGWVMYPLALVSVMALALSLERLWALRRSRVLPRAFLRSLAELMEQGRYEEAAFLCREARSSAARLVAVALKMAGKKPDIFRQAMEETGRKQAAALSAHLEALRLMASLSPLLGLLGTVCGLIEAFGILSSAGAASAEVLAGGVAQALISTAAGLTVAIGALAAHHFLAGRAERFTGELEDLGGRLLRSLAEDGERS